MRGGGAGPFFFGVLEALASAVGAGEAATSSVAGANPEAAAASTTARSSRTAGAGGAGGAGFGSTTRGLFAPSCVR